MTACCVLRSGSIYTAMWVERLQRQVERHLAPERFVCLSDIAVPCDRIALKHGWPNWWSKCELTAPGNFPDGELVLYVDLDTVIVGDLSPLRSYERDFATLRDFYSPEIAASGVMLWRAGTVPIYEAALAEPMFPPRHHGRSDNWWNTVIMPDDYLQDAFPGMFGSYKVDNLEEGPGDFAVCCFHGVPKQCDLSEGWVAEAWQ